MLYVSDLGTVTVKTKYGERATTITQSGKATYAQLQVNEDRLTHIVIEVEVSSLALGAKVFAVFGGQAVELENTFQFTVPIDWDGEKPRTRSLGRDNLDVVILLPNGEFIDVQCGVVTRKGRFVLTAQQVWRGQVVRTRDEGNRVVSQYVATDPIHAFPGSDYGSIWQSMAEDVMRHAEEIGASDQKSRAKVAEWQPPTISAEPDERGYYEAVVYFFNVVSGTGYVANADGKRHFVHFSSVLNPTDPTVPVLTPMTVVKFRPGTERGRAICKSVKIPDQQEVAAA